MAYVYRYTDLSDGIIKYVGIVWSRNRTLEQRINEHKREEWHFGKSWKIEFICEDIETRTDAEYFESHYISLFKTDRWFNKSKSDWGTSGFLPVKSEWKLYSIEEISEIPKRHNLHSRKYPLWKSGKLYERNEKRIFNRTGENKTLYEVILFKNGRKIDTKLFENIYKCSDELKVSVRNVDLAIKGECSYITYGKRDYAIYNGNPSNYRGYCLQIKNCKSN